MDFFCSNFSQVLTSSGLPSWIPLELNKEIVTRYSLPGKKKTDQRQFDLCIDQIECPEWVKWELEFTCVFFYSGEMGFEATGMEMEL